MTCSDLLEENIKKLIKETSVEDLIKLNQRSFAPKDISQEEYNKNYSPLPTEPKEEPLTKEQWMSKIRLNPSYFSSLPEKFQNIDFLVEAINTNFNIISYQNIFNFLKDIKKSKEDTIKFVIETVKACDDPKNKIAILKFIPLEYVEPLLPLIQNDQNLPRVLRRILERKTYVLKVLKNLDYLKQIPDDKKDYSFYTELFGEDGWDIQHMIDTKDIEDIIKTETNEACLLALIRYNARIVFPLLVEKYKSLVIPSLCLAAVERKGDLLQHVPSQMKTVELCTAAVKQDLMAFRYVPESLKNEVDQMISNKSENSIITLYNKILKEKLEEAGIETSSEKEVEEDVEKKGNKWVNKGKEGTHGEFDTKKDAEAQMKAMYANGYKG